MNDQEDPPLTKDEELYPASLLAGLCFITTVRTLLMD